MSSQHPAVAAARAATSFDQWYADLSTSPARDAIVARTLGLPGTAPPARTPDRRQLDHLISAEAPQPNPFRGEAPRHVEPV